MTTQPSSAITRRVRVRLSVGDPNRKQRAHGRKSTTTTSFPIANHCRSSHTADNGRTGRLARKSAGGGLEVDLGETRPIATLLFPAAMSAAPRVSQARFAYLSLALLERLLATASKHCKRYAWMFLREIICLRQDMRRSRRCTREWRRFNVFGVAIRDQQINDRGVLAFDFWPACCSRAILPSARSPLRL